MSEQPEGVSDTFTVDNDELAAWAMRKARAAQQQIDTVNSIYRQEREALDAYREQETAKHQRDLDFFTFHLTRYALEQREREGRKSITLPAGKITTRATTPKVDLTDEAQFIEWAKTFNPALVKVKETASRTDLNKLIVDDKVVDENGEIIPGVSVIPGGINASIEVAK